MAADGFNFCGLQTTGYSIQSLYRDQCSPDVRKIILKAKFSINIAAMLPGNIVGNIFMQELESLTNDWLINIAP